MLGFLAETSRNNGATFLRGWFLPTKKNAPAGEIYPSHQFQPVATEDGQTLWSLNLEEANIPYPEWIRLHVTNGSYRAEQARAS